MFRVSVVLGSMFGDEGKGHMTDVLCNNPKTLNVRFNGGAQASHTVVTPEGNRHAFRHFGSGTFLDVPTFLTEHFIINPFSYILEREELINSFNLIPMEYVHPSCIVTTLWDMYINQAVEEMRGESRHGSCGLGINETVQRSNIQKYKITVKDILDNNYIKNKLENIQKEYVPLRLKEEYGLCITDLPQEYQNLLNDDEIIEMHLFYFYEFLSNITIANYEIFEMFDNVVFEGAQGLLLDQNNSEYFPNVTTSNTGLKNVLDILKIINYQGNLEVYYITRCYATRHGVGLFKSEIDKKPYSNIIDLTNTPNKFQGCLRFGYLDFDTLSQAINKDLLNLTFKAKINVVITCIDQLDSVVKYIIKNNIHEVKKDDFISLCWNILKDKINDLSDIYLTNGLTRNDFFKYKK